MTQEVPAAVDAPLGVGARVLYSILFGLVFWLLAWALAFTTVAQLVVKLVGSGPSTDLTRFGSGLAQYASQLIRFLTCGSERLPFPFSDWPDVPTRLNRDDFEHL